MQTRSKTAAEKKENERKSISGIETDVGPSEMMEKYKKMLEAQKQRMVSDVKPSERMQLYKAQLMRKETTSSSSNASSAGPSHN